MTRFAHRYIASFVVAALALGFSTRASALGDEGCCGGCVKVSGEVAKKLDAAIEDWGRAADDMKAMPADARERLTQATSVLHETNPGFALMPATLQTATQLLDAASAMAKPCSGDECETMRGDADKSKAVADVVDVNALNAKTSALFNASLHALAASTFAAAPGSCCAASAASATTAKDCCAKAGEANASASKDCCAAVPVVATISNEALVVQADQLLEKWSAAQKSVAALSPEQRTKYDQALTYASANCPIGKRMLSSFAIGRDALATSMKAVEQTGSTDRVALVKKATALVDAARTTLR
ncbi:MAG: hypothetical protein HYR85_26785 [Planctomycetes bacterium]|nr:hypothetical protein [Planctomycetota bacterium]